MDSIASSTNVLDMEGSGAPRMKDMVVRRIINNIESKSTIRPCYFDHNLIIAQCWKTLGSSHMRCSNQSSLVWRTLTNSTALRQLALISQNPTASSGCVSSNATSASGKAG